MQPAKEYVRYQQQQVFRADKDGQLASTSQHELKMYTLEADTFPGQMFSFLIN